MTPSESVRPLRGAKGRLGQGRNYTRPVLIRRGCVGTARCDGGLGDQGISHWAQIGRTARRFAEYFAIFPWDRLPEGAAGAGVGCGSGRWTLLEGVPSGDNFSWGPEEAGAQPPEHDRIGDCL